MKFNKSKDYQSRALWTVSYVTQNDISTEWIVCDNSLWVSTKSICDLIEKPPKFAANLMAYSKNQKGAPLLRLRVSTHKVPKLSTYMHHSEIQFLHVTTLDLSELKVTLITIAKEIKEQFSRTHQVPLADTPIPNTIGTRNSPQKWKKYKDKRTTAPKKEVSKAQGIAALQRQLDAIAYAVNNNLKKLEKKVDELQVQPTTGGQSSSMKMMDFKKELKRMGFEIKIIPIEGE